jgi:membrane protein DedA with SNARE-associated domain
MPHQPKKIGLLLPGILSKPTDVAIHLLFATAAVVIFGCLFDFLFGSFFCSP